MEQNNNQVLALPMECWRWVTGFEGIYQVSTRGRVRSVDRWATGKDGVNRFFKGLILKPARDKQGYLYVKLYRDGKGRDFFIHRIVAMAWLDNPENKPQINHLNEQKDMNFVENLSWTTAKENVNWGTGIKRGHDSLLNGSRSKPVQAINPETGEVVREFPSTMEAGRNGFGQGAVSACCLGKYKYNQYKGFIWRFKE